MTVNLIRPLKQLVTAGGAAFIAAGLAGLAGGQTLPIAGDPRAAVAQDQADRREAQGGLGGVREQDNAAQRTANRLNRDARQEARQAALQGAAEERADFREGGANLQGATGMQSGTGLRGADLGVWLNSRPGMNGLVVADLADRGAFAQAGLREGDRIVSINGQPVTSESQFVQNLTMPGSQAAAVIVDRNGQQQTLTIQPSAIMQGVTAHDPLFQTGLLVDQRNPNQIIVDRVFPRTPAFYAGLRPGDVITGINGQPASSLSNLSQMLQSGAGNLALQVNRNGQTRDLTLASAADNTVRTAMQPRTGLQTGTNTTNQVDQSGLNTRGTVNPATSTTAQTSVPGATTSALTAGLNTTPGVTTSGATVPSGAAATIPQGPSTALDGSSRFAPTVPSGALPPAASQPSAPGAAPVVSSGALTPGVNTLNPSGAFVPGAALPGTSPVTPLTGGRLGTSGISPASPAVPAFGSPGAAGATGTTGGTGSTAGGAGAVGGTGAAIGGTGSTAGPSGGTGGATAAGGTGAAGSGSGGAAAGAGGAGGGGGAAAGGT